MAKVCAEWFPEGSFRNQKGAGFFLDDDLKAQLDILIKNIVRDWDFTLIIGGEGKVRVGKSTLAIQIGAYWAYQVEKMYGKKTIFNVNDNIIFHGEKLIEAGNKLGSNFPYSPLIFDEAGADLDSKKVMRRSTQNVLDYFRECGQYNLLNILVIPEFFDLPRGLAVSRSIALINVTCEANSEDIFERGSFKFYSAPQKKKLYIVGRKFMDYSVADYDFDGHFIGFYPIDEQEYRNKKKEALLSRKEAEKEQPNKKELQRNLAIYLLHEQFGMTTTEIKLKFDEFFGMETDIGLYQRAIKQIEDEKEGICDDNEPFS
jgi:hypothetical protein